jgi:hypothetical protein
MKVRTKELLEMSDSCRFSETSGRVLGRARDIEARCFAYIRNIEAEARAGIFRSSTMQPARFASAHTHAHTHTNTRKWAYFNYGSIVEVVAIGSHLL